MRKLLWTLGILTLVSTCPLTAQAGSYEDFLTYIQLDDAPRLNQLLRRGLDPNTITQNGTPAIIEAMNQGSEQVVEALLNSPTLDVNFCDAKEDSPLMIASARNKPEWVSILLKKGAIHTEAGRWNALHYAASAGALSVIELLLKAGADINVHSANNTTPLMMAARSGKDLAARLLMRQGAELGLTNDAGFDAYAYAVRAQRTELANEIATALKKQPHEE